MSRQKIITITGPTASGKTTLGNLLAEHLNYQFIPEEFEDNPYLADFNKGQGSFYDAQVWFIQRDIERYQRALGLAESGIGIILDKPFYQNYAFVLATPLSSDERNQCLEMISAASKQLEVPDLLIDIYAEPELIIERIKQRGRSIETELPLEWFQRLKESHADTLPLWPELKTFKFDSSTRNFIANLELVRELLSDIELETGEVFTPSEHQLEFK